MKYTREEIFIGSELVSNGGDIMIVIDKKKILRKGSKSSYHSMSLVQFKDTPHTKWVYDDNLVAGKVKNPYRITRVGVGYLGDFAKNSYSARARQLWSNVLGRCYTDRDKGYLKFGTEVDTRWHCFANFLEDLPKLENFDKWLEDGDIKYNLDKDLKAGKQNIYSLNTCMFLDEHTNKSDGGKCKVKDYYRNKVMAEK